VERAAVRAAPEPRFRTAAGAVLVLLQVLCVACRGHETPAREPRVTNATVTFQVHSAGAALDRPVRACLVVAKPEEQPLQNGGGRAGAVDGSKEFAAGTRATDVVAHYAALLARHGWTAGRDFVAAGNALHFYGVSALGGGSGNAQLGVYGATDSEQVPYRDVAPVPR
jgi:hypothetical protein